MKNKNKLEWYVLNYCDGEIKMWNIFNNWVLEEDVQKQIKLYKKDKLTYDEFKEEVRRSVMWQEWSRSEYEILVHPWVDEIYENKFKKVDCYYQIEPNLDALCHYLIKE